MPSTAKGERMKKFLMVPRLRARCLVREWSEKACHILEKLEKVEDQRCQREWCLGCLHN